MSRKLTRRGFISGAGAIGLASVIGACVPAPTATPQPAPTKAVATAAPQGATAVPTKPAPTAAPALSGKLTAVFHGSVENPYWTPRLELFRKENPKVEFVALPTEDDNQFVQKVSTMMAGGTPPDLLKLTGGRMIALAPTKVLADLKPYLDKSSFMQQIWKEVPGEGKEFFFIGKQLAIPLNYWVLLFAYNKDLMDAKGVTITNDWTWDDLVNAGLKVTDAKANVYGYTPSVHTFQMTSIWWWDWGTTVFSPDCAHVNFEHEGAIKSMEFMADLFVKHKIAPSPELKLGDIGVSFDTGKIGMIESDTGGISGQLGEKKTWKFNWRAVVPPKGPVAQTTGLKSDAFSVVNGAKAPEMAWAFIEWWYKEETQTALANMGEPVARRDIRNKVALPKLPDWFAKALEKAGEIGRGYERCPGWSDSQKVWMQEMAPCWLGRANVRETMLKCDKIAEDNLVKIMEEYRK